MARTRHQEPLTDVTGRRIEASPGGIIPPEDAVRGEARAKAAVGRSEGTGVTAGLLLLILLGAALVVMVAQNVEDVPFSFLWWEATVPLAVLLLVSALGTLVVDQAVGVVWRRRRRRARAMRPA